MQKNSSSKTKELEEYRFKYETFTQSALWTKVKNNWQSEFIKVKERLPLRKVFMYALRGTVCDMSDFILMTEGKMLL